MKEITKYVAFDGTEFMLKSECEHYEAQGLVDELERLQKEMMWGKQVALPDAFKRYRNAKTSYCKACTKSMTLNQRARLLEVYAAAKTNYTTAVEQFYSLKRHYCNLKEKAEKAKKANQDAVSK